MRTIRQLSLCLLGGSLFAAFLAACSNRDPVEEDPYTDFDRELYARLEPHVDGSGHSRAFLTNRFTRDRPELLEFVELFRSEELGDVMRQRLIRYATEHRDPTLRANLAYLLAQADFTEIYADILANLEHEHRYLRYRAVLALPYVIPPRDLDILLPLLGDGEAAEDVRSAARDVYADLVGPEQVGDVFEALRSTEGDWRRAEFLAEVFDELLDELSEERLETMLVEVSEYFGQGLDAVDAFLLMRHEGRFGPEHAAALTQIVVEAQGEPELRQRAQRELVTMLEAGGPRERAVHEQAESLRLALLAELGKGRSERVFDAEQVYELLDHLGLDEAAVGVLRAQVLEAEVGDWRHTGERDTVAIQLLARHAPRSDWLTEKLIEGMSNLDITPAASEALLRYALEVEPDSEEQAELVEAAKQALTDARPEVARGTADGLAALGSEAAIDALLDGMREGTPEVVEVCADALLSLADSGYLAAQRYHTLWELIRESNRHRYESYHVEQALRVIELIGDQNDLQFFTHYCAVDSASSELREAFAQARQRIEARTEAEE